MTKCNHCGNSKDHVMLAVVTIHRHLRNKVHIYKEGIFMCKKCGRAYNDEISKGFTMIPKHRNYTVTHDYERCGGGF